MYTYEIDLCDEDGNTTHKGEYDIELDYQPEERVGGHLFAGECVTVSSIKGPDNEEVGEDDFKEMYEEMNDVKMSDDNWQEFLMGLMGVDEESTGRVKHYARWW